MAPQRTGPGALTRVTRRVTAWLRSPRGAATAVVLAVVAVGALAALLTLGQGPGRPRITFPDADGAADDVRLQVSESVRGGTLSESLAPGRGDETAARLADAPAIFLSVAVDPDAATPVKATQRIVVTNTSDTDLTDVRLHVLAPAVGADLRLVSAEVGGHGVEAHTEATTMTLPLRDPLATGAATIVDLSWDLTPARLAEPEDLNPAEVLGPGAKSAFQPQLVRRNLMYLFDWYPRPEPLGPRGWEPLHVDPLLADTHGPATNVELEVSSAGDWQVAAGGSRTSDEGAGATATRRFVLAGSRVAPLVLQRNSVERVVSKGAYRGVGVGLDTFGPAVEDAAGQALAAKAAMSQATGAPFWRDVTVVGLAFGGDATYFVADNVVFIRQDVLARGVPGLGPNTQPSEYRQAAFEGSTAEWWGGVVDVDATTLPALRAGVRASSAALAWRACGGDAVGRVATATAARRYRVARSAGAPDVPADLPATGYAAVGQRDVAAAKGFLVYQGLAVELTEDGPAAWGGSLAAFGALSRAAMLDVDAVAAAGTGAGLAPARADVLARTWLQGTAGDVTIGRVDGQGSIVYFTDGAAADTAAGANPVVPLDLDAVQGAGPGW